ncbi:hypothetical protein VTK56DRAFT_1235 [Thermocarpiscus australiensis]
MDRGLRQQPGLACEECRRRKARCDRARPRCGTCTVNGTDCVVVEKRPQRGPKKGQLKALRSRVAMLERQLQDQTGSCEGLQLADAFQFEDPGSVTPPSVRAARFDDVDDSMRSVDMSLVLCADWLNDGSFGWPDTVVPVQASEQLSEPTPSPATTLADLELSDLAWADLDQLYFDRIHPVTPITHKRRYLSWASQENPSPARACLRMAMRTVASAVSAQYRSLGDVLYAETRRMLEALDAAGGEQVRGLPWITDRSALRPGGGSMPIPLEQIQAWLLVAHYEILCMQEQRALLTAADVFRLVQLSRLYDVDAADLSPISTIGNSVGPVPSPDDLGDSFAETEEKRRTFWLAFTLDGFLSMCHSERPLTLHEEIIRTRLPAPEANFQNSQPIRTGFLPEAIADRHHPALSPFAECVVLATIHGRSMSHRRMAHSGSMLPPKEAREFWIRHEWLAAAVEERLQREREPQRISISTSAGPLDGDPMLTFTRILARDIVIHLSDTAKGIPWKEPDHQLMAIAYGQRAYEAASDMACLANAVPQLGCFTAHPLLPSPLARSAAFLTTRTKTTDSLKTRQEKDSAVEQLCDALRRLRRVNSLAAKLLDELEMRRGHMPMMLKPPDGYEMEHDFARL